MSRAPRYLQGLIHSAAALRGWGRACSLERTAGELGSRLLVGAAGLTWDLPWGKVT